MISPVMRRGRAIAACSRGLLDRALSGPAALIVCVSGDHADTRGAWSNARGHARGGGGGPITVGLGSVYVALVLQRASSLVSDADEARIVNRHVRPLLSALSKMGVPSMYGGRDFIASRKAPIAWVGFQHSAETGRAAFEAILGVDVPIAATPRRAFLDRAPRSFRELGCKHDAQTIAERIKSAYLQSYEGLGPKLEVEVEVEVEVEAEVEAEAEAEAEAEVEAEVEVDVEVDVEVEVEVEVEVGVVGARRLGGVVTVYGDFYASRELVPRIHAGLASGIEPSACVAQAMSGAVLFGLPSTEPLTRVITSARRR